MQQQSGKGGEQGAGRGKLLGEPADEFDGSRRDGIAGGDNIGS